MNFSKDRLGPNTGFSSTSEVGHGIVCVPADGDGNQGWPAETFERDEGGFSPIGSQTIDGMKESQSCGLHTFEPAIQGNTQFR